jgi:membrane protein DedA with SNARE-associated domain
MHVLASGSAPPLPGFLDSLAGPLGHFGYWAVLLLVMLEDFGIPVPGETVLIAASVYAGAGRLNVVAVGVVGFVAAVIGDNIGFAMGHFGGGALVLRWGRYVRLTEGRLRKAEAFFGLHSAWIITVARFIEVLRQANGIVAGIAGVRWLRFLVFNALGAALWAGTWVSLGYLAGSHIDTIYHRITEYSFYVLIALAMLLAAYIAWRALRRRNRATPTREQAGRPSNRRPSASEAASMEPTASQPTEARGASPGLMALTLSQLSLWVAATDRLCFPRLSSWPARTMRAPAAIIPAAGHSPRARRRPTYPEGSGDEPVNRGGRNGQFQDE